MSFTDIAVSAGVQVHTPFLERASQPGNRERAHALGAFLTLRAVDRIAQGIRSLSDGLPFQLKAASNYLNELHPQTKDVSHLREIVRVAYCVLQSQNRELLSAPLLAFAYWLESELRIEESLDVLETALRLPAEEHDLVAAQLQRGRVLRTAGRFPESRIAYTEGRRLARKLEDFRSEMVSRIGCAWVSLKTGDIPAAEGELREVLAAARAKDDTFVEARACHDLAAVAYYAGRASAAVPLAFRAYELYEDSTHRARALNDTGVFLKELGHYSAAKEAFLTVLESETNDRVKTELELLEMASLLQDRLGFSRWRKELEAKADRLPPDDLVDYNLKLGVGLAVFGSKREGIERISQAMATAEKFGLGQRVFEAEQLMHEIRSEDSVGALSPRQETEIVAPELEDAIAGVLALRDG